MAHTCNPYTQLNRQEDYCQLETKVVSFRFAYATEWNLSQN